MTDNITIGKQMIQHQDWYYMMVDYGYTAAKEAARASMRAFVKFMNTCSVEEAATLKDMWMDAYNNARACINGR
jgi:hypothetical protein